MNSCRAIGMALMLISLLAGCSGGGSGGDSGLRVSTATKKIELNYYQGQSVATTIQIKASGTTDSEVYVGSRDESGVFSQVEIAINSETSATAVAYPRADLAPGKYSGELQLLACHESSCQHHYAGSPIKIPYTIVVKRGLQVSGDQSVVVTTAGQRAPAKFFTIIAPDDVTDLRITIPEQSWLKAQWNEPSLQIEFELMPAGVYTEEISFSTAAGAMLGTMTVSYEVRSGDDYRSSITTQPESLTLTVKEGGQAFAEVAVEVPSWATGWTVSLNDADAEWLRYSQPSSNRLRISVDATGLARGQHFAMLTLTSTGQAVRTVSMPVTANVTSGYSISLYENFSLSNISTTESLRRSIPITHSANWQKPWQAHSSVDWLVLDRSSGLTSVDEIEMHLDAAKFVATANSLVDISTVEVSVDGEAETFIIDISVQDLMADLTFAMPAAMVEGQAATLMVAGMNLDFIDLDTVLTVDSGANVGITRLSSTALEVRADAQAAGEIRLTLKNAAGLPESVVTIPVREANQALSFRQVGGASIGAKRPPFYDPVRAQFWIVDTQNDRLQRYQKGSVQWQETSIAFLNLIDATMTPDNQNIAVITRDKLVLLDADTLQEVRTINSGAIGGTTYSKQFFSPRAGAKGMIALADNTLRFTFGSDQWTEAYMWNLATDMIERFQVNNSTFYNGPVYAVSGNGKSALLNQAWGISSDYPALALSGTTGQVQNIVLEGMTSFTHGSFSEDGRVSLFDCRNVYDSRFSYLGSLPNQFEDDRISIGCTISADGERIFVATARYGTNWPYTLDRDYFTRVYVYGSSRDDVSTSTMPALGYFEIEEFISPDNLDYNGAGYAWSPMVLDQRGTHLLIAGYQGTLIVPVPALQAAKQKVIHGKDQQTVLWRKRKAN